MSPAGRPAGDGTAIEFDKELVVINRARLFVDSQEIDQTKVWSSDKRRGRTSAACRTDRGPSRPARARA